MELNFIEIYLCWYKAYSWLETEAVCRIRGADEHCSSCACECDVLVCMYCDRGMFLFPQSDQQLDCALDLMRRLPPQQIEKNLSDLIDLVSTGCSNRMVAEP